MGDVIAGLGSAIAILAIFAGSLIMATLTGTFAENLYPELDEKRDL